MVRAATIDSERAGLRPGAALVRLGVALLVGATGCASEVERRCQGELNAYDATDKSRLVTLEEDGVGPIQAQVVIPWTGSRYEAGAPVVVFVHGSWSNNHVPLGEDSARVLSGHGLIGVYLNLPGGQGDEASAGENDRRGPAAREALALVLRYAADEVRDSQGCLLSERSPEGSTDELVLAAFSNGGNLAWATLADEELDLPRITGVATFETPSAGQFVMAEPGTESRRSPIYEPGSCALTEEGAVRCAYDYGEIAWDAQASPGTEGQLFVDTDGDDRFTDEVDFPLGAVFDPLSDRWLHSLPATEAAAAAGVLPLSRGDIDDASAFWSEREAPRSMAAAAARFPELAAIEVGTEVDHVLQGAEDHPHVTGMVAAMQAAGVSWTRLHPDASYVEAVSGAQLDFADLPADLEIEVGDLTVPMEPTDDDLVRSNHYLTAAVLELADRGHGAVWDDDLDGELILY